jgi:hypothetical protein
MTTIHQLRTNLEQAQANYLSADIEHPTAVLIAKDLLTNARFDYWAACAELVTRLPGVISDHINSGDYGYLMDVMVEIKGEQI